MLDRNGLRPARYIITKDGMMVIASEAGVITFDAEDIKEKGRLRPGKIIMVDTETGEISYDAQIKEKLAADKPYTQWLTRNRVHLENITSGRTVSNSVENYNTLLKTFGYYKEDLVSITKKGKAGVEQIQEMMKNFRENHPKFLASSAIVKVIDYNNLSVTGLPKPNVLQFFYEDGIVGSVRLPGLEPTFNFTFVCMI